MLGFNARCPELAMAETRTVSTFGSPGLPDDDYGFVECYCPEEDCDCRRVLFVVMSRSRMEPVATINYGWESVAFYKKWVNDMDAARECASAFLDPLGKQSELSPGLLRVCQESLLSDPSYVARLKRHYAIFKASAPSKSKLPTMTRSSHPTGLLDAPLSVKLPPAPSEITSQYMRNRKEKLRKRKKK